VMEQISAVVSTVIEQHFGNNSNVISHSANVSKMS